MPWLAKHRRTLRCHLDKDLISPLLGWCHRRVIPKEPWLARRLPVAPYQTREQFRFSLGDLLVIWLTGEAQHRQRLSGHSDDADSVVARSRQRLQRVLRGHEEAHYPTLLARLHRDGGRHGDRLRRLFHRYRSGHRHRRALTVLGEDKVRQSHERRILSVLDAYARSHVSLGGQPRAIPPNFDRYNRIDDLERGLLNLYCLCHDPSSCTYKARNDQQQRGYRQANTVDH